jgi:hypothetical protein
MPSFYVILETKKPPFFGMFSKFGKNILYSFPFSAKHYYVLIYSFGAACHAVKSLCFDVL